MNTNNRTITSLIVAATFASGLVSVAAPASAQTAPVAIKTAGATANVSRPDAPANAKQPAVKPQVAVAMTTSPGATPNTAKAQAAADDAETYARFLQFRHELMSW